MIEMKYFAITEFSMTIRKTKVKYEAQNRKFKEIAETVNLRSQKLQETKQVN
jgi:hypothetical protein